MWVTPPARIIFPPGAYDLAGRRNATEAGAPAPGKATELTSSLRRRDHDAQPVTPGVARQLRVGYLRYQHGAWRPGTPR